MTAAPEHRFSIVRQIRASPTDLFKAWTDPSIMRRWLADVVEADARVGGAYRLEIHHDDGSLRELSGEYVVLEPAEHIVQTYVDIDVLPGTHLDEQLDVRFVAQGAALTELTLVHGWNGQPMTTAERAALEHDWIAWLDRLVQGVELPTTLEG